MGVINAGTYNLVNYANRTLALDTAGSASAANKANVRIAKRTDSDSQLLTIVGTSMPQRVLFTMNGMALDGSSKAANGQNVYQYQPNGTKPQLWSFLRTGDADVTVDGYTCHVYYVQSAVNKS